jgi:hypothetical protein
MLSRRNCPSIRASVRIEQSIRDNGPFPVGTRYGDGIQLVSTWNPVNISGNNINGAAEFGVGLYGVSNASIWENAVSHTYDGV